MRLTESQSRMLLAKHGVYATDACNKCAQILGPVRFTRSGDHGEWCSRLCRDGVEHKPGVCRGCGTDLKGKRKGALFCSDVCRMRRLAQQRQDNAKKLIEKSGVTDTIFGGICVKKWHEQKSL